MLTRYPRPQVPRRTAVSTSCSAPARLLQRKCACGASAGLDGECGECRTNKLAKKPRGADSARSSEAPPIVHEVLHSPGQPLDAKTRRAMGSRLGHDFASVRVHTDRRAAESASAVNALAYTVGSDVVFGAGQYPPATRAGRELLAHELVHVVQQDRGAAAGTPSSAVALESEAESVSTAVAGHSSASVTTAGPQALARTPQSLSQSVNPSDLSDSELAGEIGEIRKWLGENQVSSPDHDLLTGALGGLVQEAARRNPKPAKPGANRSASAAAPVASSAAEAPVSMPDQSSDDQSSSIPLAAAGMLAGPGLSGLSDAPLGPISDSAFEFSRLPGEVPLNSTFGAGAETTTALGETSAVAESVAAPALETGLATAETTAAVLETGGTALEAGTLLAEGGTVLAVESAIPVIGWIALGLTVVAIGGYLGYRYLLSDEKKPVRPLTPDENNQVVPLADAIAKAKEAGGNAADPATDDQLYTPYYQAPGVDPQTGEKLYTPGTAEDAEDPLLAATPKAPELSQEEKDAVDNKDKGRPYDKRAFNTAQRKIREAGKYQGDINKQKRKSNY